MTRVLVVDQFSGLHHAWLNEFPDVTFQELVNNIEKISGFYKPRVLEVTDDYVPPFGTTVLRAREDGRPEIWKARWDSSG
jgi:hypothetical protein